MDTYILIAVCFLAGAAGGGVVGALMLRRAKDHIHVVVQQYDESHLPRRVRKIASDPAPRIG